MKLHITDSPEWTRFFWALILLSLAAIVFSCEPEHSIEIEIIAEPGDADTLPYKVDLLLSYWYYAALAVVVWAFGMAIFGKDKVNPDNTPTL